MKRRTESNHLGGNRIGGDEKTFYPELWDYFILKYSPRTFIDIGCGEGYALEYFKQKGIETFGVDGLQENIYSSLRFGNWGRIIDFTKEALDTNFVFDIGWCCEIVEHIEEQFVDNLLKTFSKCKILVMTHALPGQKGYHHVNCKPSEYWIELLAKSGLIFLKAETEESRNFGKFYYKNSGLVFKNDRLISLSDFHI